MTVSYSAPSKTEDVTLLSGHATYLTHFRNAWVAARWKKNLPLAILVVSGSLIGNSPIDFPILLTLLVTVMAASAFMTYVNIITDRELDLEKKPELYQWLCSSPSTRNFAMGLSVSISLLGIGFLFGAGYSISALSVFLFLFLTKQYSYNLFSFSNPSETRWKCKIWGHGVVVIGGYFFLWFSGLGINAAPSNSMMLWAIPIFLVCVSEYALFLGESSIDSTQERKLGMGSVAAILGTLSACRLSLLISIASTVLFLFLWYNWEPYLGSKLIAFLPAFSIHLITLLLMSVHWSADNSVFFRKTLPDYAYFAARASTLIFLIYLSAM